MIYRYFPPKELTGVFSPHILVDGKTGSGKSNTAEYILTRRIGKYKCLDIYDDGRFENMTYFIKENNPAMIKKMHNLTSGKLKPQSFPTQIVMFAGEKLDYLKDVIPEKITIVSINDSDFSIEDFATLLGKESESLKGVLYQIAYIVGDKPISFDLIESMVLSDEVKVPPSTKYMLLRNISRWKNSPLFDTKRYDVLDFDEILQSIDVITSFSTYLQDSEDTKGMIYGYIMKKIIDAKRGRKVKHKICPYVREISNLIGRNKEQKMTLAEQYLIKILREGRDMGVHLICDTQRYGDMPPVMRKNIGITIALRQDKSEAEKHLEIMDIERHTLDNLPSVGRGVGVIITGNSYHYPVMYPPTSHYHKKEDDDVFALIRKNADRIVTTTIS